MILWIFLVLQNFYVFASDTTQVEEINPTQSGQMEDLRPSALFDPDGKLLPENACRDDINWQALENKTGLNNKWNSIGQLTGLGATCSVNLIVPPQCGDYKNKKAQVVTNGHCTRKAPQDPKVTFRMFKDIPEKDRPVVEVNELIYGTESRVDISLLELNMTYQQLEQYGILPKKISTDNQSRNLTNVGIPATCPDKTYIHQSQCQRGEGVTIVDHHRFWQNQFVAQCSVTPGSSGSGLYDDKGELTAMMNAGGVNTEAGDKPDCQVDTCTYDGRNFPRREMKNYALDVTRLHKCYKNCKFDASIAGCDLPDKQPMLSAFAPLIEGENTHWRSDWNKPIGLSSGLKNKLKNIRIKACSQGDTTCNCDDPQGYKDVYPQDMENSSGFYGFKPSDIIPAPTKPSFHVFCIIGKGMDGVWEDPKNGLRHPLYYTD